MAHEKVYGICENKCKVEVTPKTEVDTLKTEVNNAITNVNNALSAKASQSDLDNTNEELAEVKEDLATKATKTALTALDESVTERLVGLKAPTVLWEGVASECSTIEVENLTNYYLFLIEGNFGGNGHWGVPAYNIRPGTTFVSEASNKGYITSLNSGLPYIEDATGSASSTPVYICMYATETSATVSTLTSTTGSVRVTRITGII